MEKILRQFNPCEVDEYTLAEVKHFAELKYDEQQKIKGRIARDLARIGENAFMEQSAYDKLKAKYIVAHASKKKLAILELMRKTNCRLEITSSPSNNQACQI